MHKAFVYATLGLAAASASVINQNFQDDNHATQETQQSITLATTGGDPKRSATFYATVPSDARHLAFDTDKRSDAGCPLERSDAASQTNQRRSEAYETPRFNGVLFDANTGDRTLTIAARAEATEQATQTEAKRSEASEQASQTQDKPSEATEQATQTQLSEAVQHVTQATQANDKRTEASDQATQTQVKRSEASQQATQTQERRSDSGRMTDAAVLPIAINSDAACHKRSQQSDDGHFTQFASERSETDASVLILPRETQVVQSQPCRRDYRETPDNDYWIMEGEGADFTEDEYQSAEEDGAAHQTVAYCALALSLLLGAMLL